MDKRGLSHNRRFIVAASLTAALLVAIAIAEIITAGLPEQAQAVSDIAAPLCAMVAAIAFVWLWHGMNDQEASKRIWGLVALGIVLWTIAEVAWTVYELVLKVEIPYPSVADFLWLAGYIPLYAALIIRYRAFQSSASRMQRLIVLIFIVLYSAAMAVYVIQPLLEGFDASRLGESLTNLAYPVADWGLCLLTLVIIFSLERGRFASVWRLFGAGILLSATADVLYFYAAWNELYYPGGQINFFSGAIDMTFNVSYLLLALSVYAYALLAKAHPSPRISLVLRSLAKMEILIFLNREGCVLSVSDNFMNLMHVPSTKPYIGLDLAQVLGVPDVKARSFMTSILGQESLVNYPVEIRDPRHKVANGWLTSLVMHHEDAKQDSIALVLRVDPPSAGEAEYPLHKDQKELIQYYLAKTGESQIEEDRGLRTYFVAQINLLQSLIEQYCGAKVAERLVEHLSEVAKSNDWQFTRHGQDIQILQEFGGQALRNLLFPLLQEARNFTADMTDDRMVEQEIKSLDKNLPSSMAAILQKYDFQLGIRTPGRKLAEPTFAN